jgi:hypothetical protein
MHLLAQKESTSPKQKKESSLPESFLNLDLNYAWISNISDYNQEITSKPFVLKAMIGSKNSGLIIGFQTCTFNFKQELLPGGEVTQDDLRTYFGDNDDYFNILQSAGGNSYLLGETSESKLNGITMRLGYQQSIFKGLYANISADLTRIKTRVSNVYNEVSCDYISALSGIQYNNLIIEDFYQLQPEDRTILGWRLNTGIGYTFSFGKAKKIYLNTEMVYSVINKSKTIEGNMSLMAGLGYRFGTPAKTTFDGVKTIKTIP